MRSAVLCGVLDISVRAKILTDCDSFLAHQCSRFITGSGVLLVHVQGL